MKWEVVGLGKRSLKVRETEEVESELREFKKKRKLEADAQRK